MDGSAIEALIDGAVGDSRSIVWRRTLQAEVAAVVAEKLPAG